MHLEPAGRGHDPGWRAAARGWLQGDGLLPPDSLLLPPDSGPGRSQSAAAVFAGRYSRLFPAQDVVLVGAFVGRSEVVNHLVGTSRPDHHRGVSFVNGGSIHNFWDQAIESSFGR